MKTKITLLLLLLASLAGTSFAKNRHPVKSVYLDFAESQGTQVISLSRWTVNDFACIPNPGNPPAGLVRLYCDSGTGNLTCLTATGAACLASGGGSVTSIATTSPIGGGTITTSGTITCVTCVTSAASLTSNAVVIGGGLQASSTIPADTTTTHALFATAGAPGFRAIATGDLPTAIPIGNIGSSGLSGTVPVTISAAGAIACATCVTSAASLANGGLVLGTAGTQASATNTQLTFVAPTLTVGLAGTSSGILALTGSTSGSATITSPATAGTSTNPITISNSVQLPIGTVYNWNADTGLSRDSAGVVDVGTGAAGSKAGTINATTANITGTATVGTLSATTITGLTSAEVLAACTTCVTSAAALTSTAIMTGGGSQGSQTPSTTSTLSAGGAMVLASTMTDTGQVFTGSAPSVTTTGTTPYLNMNTLVNNAKNRCTFALTTSTFTLALSPVSLCTFTLPNAAVTWYWSCTMGWSNVAGTTPTFAEGVTWAQAPSTAFQMANITTTNGVAGTSAPVGSQLTTSTTSNGNIMATGTLSNSATVFQANMSGTFTSSATSGTFSPTVSLTGTSATGTAVGGCSIQ